MTFYPFSFSTAWVMLYSNTNFSKYAQTGYMRRPTQLPGGGANSCILSFAEYNDGPVP